jgi:hypothetical protein
MFFLFACFIGKNSDTNHPHKRLDELLHRYSPREHFKINEKTWTFIQYTSNGNCWMYSYGKYAGKFITTFGLFHLNAIGDFLQLSFCDGIDKIETDHDHTPKIIGNIFQVRLRNGKRIDVYLNYLNSLVYDNNCSIAQIM